MKFRGLHIPRDLPKDVRDLLEGLSENAQREHRGLEQMGAAIAALATKLGVDPTAIGFAEVGSAGTVSKIPVGSPGSVLVLRIKDGATFKDGTGNLKLAGDLTSGDRDDTLVLVSTGSEWLELARSGTVGRSLGCPVVINEDGDACNPVLRVEGDTDANLIYVNGTNDRVGISTASPLATFDVGGSVSLDGSTVVNTSQVVGVPIFRVAGFGDANVLTVDATDDRVGIGTAAPLYKLDVVGDTRLDGQLIVNDSATAPDPVLRVEGASLPNLLYLDGTNDRLGINTSTPVDLVEVVVGIGQKFVLEPRDTPGAIAFEFDEFGVVTAQQASLVELSVSEPSGGEGGCTTNFVPDSPDARDLGNPANNWDTLYVNRMAGSSIILDVTNIDATTQPGFAYTVVNNDAVVVTSASGLYPALLTVTLPDATANTGRQISVKDVSGLLSNTELLRVTAAVGNVDNQVNQDLFSPYAGGTWTSDGSNWWRLSN